MVRRSRYAVLATVLVLAASSPGLAAAADGAAALNGAAALDDATARKAMATMPDRVFAALVQIQSACHPVDTICIDGAKVLEVFVSRAPASAKVKAGDWIPLNLGPGKEIGLPAIGDQVLFVGEPSVEKDGTKSYVVSAFSIDPGPKAVDEFKAIIKEPVAKPAE